LGEPGCMGCHNIHESMVVDGHEPFENECTDCHSATVPDGYSPQVDLSKINHLAGPGTPLDGTANHACETCHMTEHAYHFFRISTDPNYETKTGTSTGPDNTADDNGYADAVWLDLDIACGQCHGGGTDELSNPPLAGVPYRTKAQLAGAAEGMHDSAGVTYSTTFSASVVAGTLDVNVNAIVNCGGTCPALTYDWNWGDGSEDLGVGASTSHTYATAGVKTITLTVQSAAGAVGSATRSVTIHAVDDPPVAGCSVSLDAATQTATVTDTSTDDNAVTSVQVRWGDGLMTSGAGGGTYTHTYRTASSYSVSLTAIDSALQSDFATCGTVNVIRPTFSGVVKDSSGTPVGKGIVVRLKRNGSTDRSTKTASDGTFSISSRRISGSYIIQASKSGMTFPAYDAVDTGETGIDIQALP